LVDAPVVPSADTAHWREGNPSFIPYKVGQLVLRKVVLQGHQLDNKLAGRYVGPFKVVRVHDNKVTYVIQSVESGTEVRVHHAQLRQYHEPPNYLVDHPYYCQLFSELKFDVVSDDDNEQRVPEIPVNHEVGPMSFSSTESSSSDSSTDSCCNYDSSYDSVSSESDGYDSNMDSDGFSGFSSCSRMPKLGKRAHELLDDMMAIHRRDSSGVNVGTLTDQVPVLDLVDPVSDSVVPLFAESNDVELWEFSDGDQLSVDSGPPLPTSFNYDSENESNDQPNHDFSGYIQEVLDCMDHNIQMVETLVGSSFSGFSDGRDVGQISVVESSNSLESSHAEVEQSLVGWSDRLADTSLRLSRLRDIVACSNSGTSSAELHCRRSPVVTRSRGLVPNYPFVQPRILEYHSFAVPVSESECEQSLP